MTVPANLPSNVLGPLTNASWELPNGSVLPAVYPYSGTTGYPTWNVETAGDESSGLTTIATSTFAPVIGTTSEPTSGYYTTINTATDRQAQEFWGTVALTASRQALQTLYATSTWTVAPGGKMLPNTIAVAAWGALLMKLSNYNEARAPEQEDIINVVKNSLLASDPDDYSSPSNLLRACAVGASLSAAIMVSPHIYAATGGRIVLDYALSEGRFTAVVTNGYVHLVGDLHGEFRERTITNEKYDLLELKDWAEAR